MLDKACITKPEAANKELIHRDAPVSTVSQMKLLVCSAINIKTGPSIFFSDVPGIFCPSADTEIERLRDSVFRYPFQMMQLFVFIFNWLLQSLSDLGLP
jgi:hypothetical protein